jgi:hypothetical protein
LFAALPALDGPSREHEVFVYCFHLHRNFFVEAFFIWYHHRK